jgi:recombinational DNA repair ATPase RecF
MLVLRVRTLGPTRLERSVELDIDRTVLYGPNAAGKLFIIRALAYLLSSEGVRDNLVFEVRNVCSYARLFGYADVELCEDNRCATLELIYRTSFMPRASI